MIKKWYVWLDNKGVIHTDPPIENEVQKENKMTYRDLILCFVLLLYCVLYLIASRKKNNAWKKLIDSAVTFHYDPQTGEYYSIKN